MIIEKLRSGVPPKRIVEEARKLENSTVERINLLNSSDVYNLLKKINIKKRRDNLHKHVHLVNMHEKGECTDFVLNQATQNLAQYSHIQTELQEGIIHYMEVTDQVDGSSNTRNIWKGHLMNWLDNNLDDLTDEEFDKFKKHIDEGLRIGDQRKNKAVTTKRKMETQEYYPSK